MRLNSEIKEVVYQYGLQVRNNDEAWNFMWKRYLEENDLYDKKDILFAMTTIANTTLLESLMKKAANESEVRKHEYLDLMNSIAENPKGFVLVTRLIYSNWTHLVKNYGANQASFFANNVRAFYRKNSKSTDSARDRTQTIDEINNNIHWMNKHRTYVQKWFQGNVYMPWRSMRLPDFIQPNRYNITLQPDIVTTTFTGEETIDFNVTRATDYIIIHEKELNITKTEVRDVGGKKIAVAEVISYKRNDFLVIRFEDKAPPGSYVLQLEFSGRFSSDGKGVARYKYFDRATRETRFVLATQFEATFARKVFPCFDEPAMKAKFQLTIIHDSHQNALSNMPEMEKEPLENGLTKTVFLESTTMSTYLLFFAVSDFEYIEAYYKEKLTYEILLLTFLHRRFEFSLPDRLPEAQHGLNLTLNLLKSFEEYFDVPYSLPKLDSVIIENYTVPAMEHWGIISYNTKRFLVDENYSTYKRMIEVDRVIAHEIVHQWFGNLVTMKWWNDLWLSEGLATLIMYIPLKQYYTEIDGVDVRKISRVMCVDSNTDSHPVVRNVTTPNEIANAFDAISYEKGSAVLKMLQHTLKDDFRKGLSNYLKKYAFKNAGN
ncbi:glutamyl aminopeptidase [Caerostris extrusa]|uniref:Glutamyl aminopeptidase n=1 Tax=Caerostris extrusa TaxID=172846 RepID=A0AAV4XYA8_CAEEX|nr:glutamyl aminopeptidase [Caerostris extrusa]